MQHSPHLCRFSLSLAFVALLTACGKSNPLDRPTKAKGTMSQTQAQSVASDDNMDNFSSAAVGSTDGSSTASTGGNTSTLMNVMSQALHTKYISNFDKVNTLGISDLGGFGCNGTLTPTNPTDADGDLIPASLSISYDCNVSSGPITSSVSGSASATDKNDQDPYGGFTFNLNNVKTNASLGSLSVSLTFNAALEATKSTDTYSAKYDLVVDGSAAGVDLTVGHYIDMVINPTSMSTPKNSGSVSTLNGFLKFKANGNNKSVDIVLAISSSGLTYTNSCEGFNAGTMTLTDGSSNSMVATFASNCTATYTYNGTSITPESSLLSTL